MARHEKTAGARVSTDAFEAIEAAAFVRRETMQGLLRPLLESFAAELREDPIVKKALDARNDSDLTRGATVTELGAKSASRS
jgi:hypothetical protein